MSAEQHPRPRAATRPDRGETADGDRLTPSAPAELDGPAGSGRPEVESLSRALARGASDAPSPGRFWRDARRRRLLAFADCCAAAIALVAAVPPERAIWMLAFLPAWVLVAKLVGLYDRDHRSLRHLTVDEAPAIAAWAAIGVVVIGLLGELTPAGGLDTGELAVALAVALPLDLLLRAAARATWRVTTPEERVLVVGEGDLAHSMRRKLRIFSDLHMRAVEPGQEAGGVDR